MTILLISNGFNNFTPNFFPDFFHKKITQKSNPPAYIYESS